MDNRLRILYSPDDGGGSGGGTDTGSDGGESTSDAPPTDAPPPAFDMSSKVKMADGSEVTVGELMNGYQKHGEVVQERDALATRMEGVMSLFDEGTAPEQREKVTRQILQEAGYGAQEVDAYIDVVGMNSETEPDYEDYDVGDTTNNNTNTSTKAEAPADDSRMKALEQELAAMKAGVHQSRVRELESNLSVNLDRVLDSHPKLKLLFEKTRDMQPSDADERTIKEAVARAKAAVKGQLKREALERLNERRNQAGTFQDTWMQEEIDKAVEPVLSIYQSVIGDIDRLGRTPETVAGQSGRDILSEKPVPKPDWKAGEDNQAKLRAWTEDSLLRMAASGTGEAKV